MKITMLTAWLLLLATFDLGASVRQSPPATPAATVTAPSSTPTPAAATVTTATVSAKDSLAHATNQKSSAPKLHPITVISLNCKKPGYYFPDDYINIQTDEQGFADACQHRDSLRLEINGIIYPKIKPLFFNHDSLSIVFRLSLDTSKASPWQVFYAWPNYWTFHHDDAKIGLTLGRCACGQYGQGSMNLYTTARWMVYIAYLLFLSIIALLIWKGKGLLRDTTLYSKNGVKFTRTPTSIEAGTICITDVPFSLARFQFMFWLLIIFFGILHIWGIADTLATPTGSVLMLLGISGGTFYLSNVIDKTPSSNSAQASAQTPVTTTTPAVTPAATTDPNAAPPTPEQTPAQKAVASFVNNQMGTRGFIEDMLNDGKSICLHRMQLLMFTVFLGIYFVWQVMDYLTLPQFSETMMLLMGISSTTYAGMKTTE